MHAQRCNLAQLCGKELEVLRQCERPHCPKARGKIMHRVRKIGINTSFIVCCASLDFIQYCAEREDIAAKCMACFTCMHACASSAGRSGGEILFLAVGCGGTGGTRTGQNLKCRSDLRQADKVLREIR